MNAGPYASAVAAASWCRRHNHGTAADAILRMYHGIRELPGDRDALVRAADHARSRPVSVRIGRTILRAISLLDDAVFARAIRRPTGE